MNVVSRPTGTVTFLFTDIEGSTSLWEQHHEAMRTALAHHDALLRAAIEGHNGYVFKTVGDAFCAAFATARDAVTAACDAHLALAATGWDATGPLRVRIGLHTGNADERDQDYFGPTLNRVARLQGIAWGGQTVLSQATARLIEGNLPDRVVLHDLGLHQLKDLQQAEHVYMLAHLDLPAEFPPLRSQSLFPNNLPQRISSFVGRQRELAEVKAQLAQCPLLTLTGAGGTGKTRLAIQVAEELLEEYPDGVWLVELAAVSDGGMVPQALATVLRLRETVGRPLIVTLIDYLRARKTLVVLDNCEHLTDACAFLADSLLRECPNLRIIATSRELLGVYGELAWRLPPMAAPDPRDLPDDKNLVAVISEYQAVELFVERARGWRQVFALTAQNARDVAKICHQLDGIPLAIELAAARVRSLSVEQIAQRLDDRFRLLTGGNRTALPHHQTLRALIDWSYQLLMDQEQTLLHCLAVFSGGWTLEAAEAICVAGGLDQGEILDLLTSLVDKSLVSMELQPSDGSARYRLLETIRQYSVEKLVAQPYWGPLRQRHYEWYLELAEQAEPQLVMADQQQWFACLEAEHDNLHTALNWAETMGVASDASLRLVGALGTFWLKRGHFTEGKRWLEPALRLQGGTAAIRARALRPAAFLTDYGGDSALAISRFEEALVLTRAAGDLTLLADALDCLGFALRHLDPERATACLEEALQIADQLDNEWLRLQTLSDLGFQQLLHGDLQRARTLFDDGMIRSRRTGSPSLIGELIYHRALVACAERDFSTAHKLLEECLAIKRPLGDKQNVGAALYHLGHVWLGLGDVAQARSQFLEGVVVGQDLGDHRIMTASIEGSARAATAGMAFDRSVVLFGAAAQERQLIGTPPPPFWHEYYLRDQAVARTALGEAAYATSWEHGLKMTLTAACRYALEEMPS